MIKSKVINLKMMTNMRLYVEGGEFEEDEVKEEDVRLETKWIIMMKIINMGKELS